LTRTWVRAAGFSLAFREPPLLKIWVYRFSYVDRKTGETKTAEDFATEAAIQEIGARIHRDMGKEVDANSVGRAGYVMLDYVRRLAYK
jgi:Flp pilus assembly CpaF family ATPase